MCKMMGAPGAEENRGIPQHYYKVISDLSGHSIKY